MACRACWAANFLDRELVPLSEMTSSMAFLIVQNPDSRALEEPAEGLGGLVVKGLDVGEAAVVVRGRRAGSRSPP